MIDKRNEALTDAWRAQRRQHL